MSNKTINIACSIADHISAAFQQNAIAAIYEIAIANGSDDDLHDVTVRLVTEPAFLSPTVWRIDRIPAHGTHHVAKPDIDLDAGLLRRLGEGLRAEVTVLVATGEEELARWQSAIRLLPPSHWGGTGTAPELLAAFVRPNDPAVDLVLHAAGTKLAAAGRDNAIDGYASGRKVRVWEIAEAIWVALATRGITYLLPPASFERSGQKVRQPGEIVERRVGTCLDLTLLYAACLEQAGLNPLVVLTEGHAFAGLWLKDEDFANGIVDDAQILRKRRDLEDIVLIETTLLTRVPPPPFSAAVRQGASQVEEGAQAALELALDVRRARARQIRPLDLGDGPAVATSATADEAAMALELETPPPFGEEVVGRIDAERPADRLESWKRKLLDLSLRNKLLNFKDTRKAVAIECPAPERLEDMLAEGHGFKLLPRTEVLAEGDPRSAELFAQRHHDDGRRRYVLDALARGELHTHVPEKELDARLTELFRLTRTAFEEGGANILHLALGFLTWTDGERAPAARAPILLIPVALERTSVRAGFRLRLHEDEARVNPTLLQMLRQHFDLRLPELEGDLPTDGSGLHVARIWQIVRTRIRDLKGWEVTGEVVLATFSFTKYLMWKDLVERIDLLKRHPVVRHLIDTPNHSYGDPSTFPAMDRLDTDYHPKDLFTPLSADSSQLAAVVAAASGKDFVLHGPPGTGKSQTIANMIAQCLAQGRTVLFVSQKTAALEVVQRRLKDIGLGEYCLEVHSTKAQKSAVLGQLKTAWHDRAAPPADDWAAATAELGALRDELNGLVSALHRRRANGMTAHAAFGRLIAHQDRFTSLALRWPSHHEHAAETVAGFRAICRELKTAAMAAGDIAGHPLAGIDLATWTPAWRHDMDAALAELVASLPRLDDALRAFLDLAVGMPVPVDHEALGGLVSLGAILIEPRARIGCIFLSPHGGSLRHALQELRRLQDKAGELRRGLSGPYQNGVFAQEPGQLLAAWQAAAAASFLFRGSRQRKVRQQLEPFVAHELPADLGRDLALLVEIADLMRRATALTPVLGTFGNVWAGLDTDTGWFEPFMEWAGQAARVIAVVGPSTIGTEALRDQVVRLLTAGAPAWQRHGAGWTTFKTFHECWQTATAALDRLSALAGRAAPVVPMAADPAWSEATVTRARRWQANLYRAQAWSQWNTVAARARAAGLSCLVEALTDGSLAPEEVETAFEVAYARWWADGVVTEDPVLRTFLATRHEDVIARFRAADARVGELSKQIVRGRLAGTVPRPTAFGSDPEWGLLARELTRKVRHLPLRQLFGKIPTVLTRLTPCVMMSPLSIAQYLPPDARAFDVVIFDEASQIPVWDAIGAIARGRQVVIAGDTEQLPPTSIGERGVDEVDDGSDVADQESILSECRACNLPSCHLAWHYRSRHESLIAFSNRHYYEGRLITFPSPVTEDRAVRYVHVPNGVYERGGGRVNHEEARAVVAEIVRRLTATSFLTDRRSLGVVTFNGEQQRLIENLLDQERRGRPEIERFFDPTRWAEPVFVKNLENVQGDERDVIIFSVAVGPDAAGRIAAQFSSLNREGGYRRLNVAITRARRELVVFATLRPEQIDLSRTNAHGVRDFKHFLEYAERGAKALAETFAATGRPAESPFEEAVKAALEAKGWEVHTQIGVSGFRIDLGVVHPDACGRYLAGIECDGATYHRSATARDRDRLREMVLTDLGWRIRRVWSTEWWQHAASALDKLHDRLVADLEQDRRQRREAAEPVAAPAEPVAVPPAPSAAIAAGPPAPAPSNRSAGIQALPPLPFGDAPPPPTDAAPLVPASDPVAARAYRFADVTACGHSPDPARFHDPLYRPVLRAMVAHVLAEEAPLFADLLVTRIARAHGFERSGAKIRNAVLNAVDHRIARTEEDERIVLWPSGGDPSRPVPFRPASPDVRRHGDVPTMELAGLARQFVDDGADIEETVRRIAGQFGLTRLEQATRARFAAAATQAMRAAGQGVS